MKKIGSIAALLSISLLAACGSGANSETGSQTGGEAASASTGQAAGEKKKIELTYWYSWGDKIGENNENLVKMFNESQDEIVVKAEYQGSYDEQNAKAQAAFAAGNAPDVWQNEISFIGVFAQSGMTQDLTAFAEKDKLDLNDFNPGLMGNSYVDGKLYGLPYLRSTPLLYFNKTLLKEAGLDPNGPKNWQEFEDYARKLTVKDKRVGITLPPDIWFYEAFVAQGGGKMISEDGKKAEFNSAAGIDPLKLWLKMKNEGIISMPTTDDKGALAKTDFQNQRSAMLFSSTADLTKQMQVAQENGFELGAAFMPAGKQYGVPTGGCNLVMSAKLPQEKQEAAWKFIKWMTEKEQTIYASSYTGYLPSRLSAVDSDEMKKLYEEKPLFKIAVDQLQYGRPRPMLKVYPEIAKNIVDEISRAVVDPSVTAEAALGEAASKADKLLNQ
ncbi:ABC transporter substrate-binding protein [Paenibacillus beijingensis]|uniref:Glycerol-3-phosphate ABC transporter substrate-binding protein n=1 Tax=Paenibacillus beijingensis TaxID=1126833 RepID=A0A0D5NII1_9BACL|nr:ABC transporter substrate-binding protein [Paenibacillus beijingensis]AJY75169.1 glycerol-3-phosphate ABC transporter substrate-binding protein [Paenibacillus beijingensis]